MSALMLSMSEEAVEIRNVVGVAASCNAVVVGGRGERRGGEGGGGRGGGGRERGSGGRQGHDTKAIYHWIQNQEDHHPHG